MLALPTDVKDACLLDENFQFQLFIVEVRFQRMYILLMGFEDNEKIITTDF